MAPWLDEPARYPREQMAEELDSLRALQVSSCVLLGMGGSSLAPEVLRRASGASSFHVLDTTHPAAIRALETRIDPHDTLFIAASKSGSTLETRCHVDYFWRKGRTFAAITDPESISRPSREREFAAVVGRADHRRPLLGFVTLRTRSGGADGHRRGRAHGEGSRCRTRAGARATPGSNSRGARKRLARGPRQGCDQAESGGFGLWAEQLLAESTGKRQGSRPRRRRRWKRRRPSTRQAGGR